MIVQGLGQGLKLFFGASRVPLLIEAINMVGKDGVAIQSVVVPEGNRRIQLLRLVTRPV